MVNDSFHSRANEWRKIRQISNSYPSGSGVSSKAFAISSTGKPSSWSPFPGQASPDRRASVTSQASLATVTIRREGSHESWNDNGTGGKGSASPLAPLSSFFFFRPLASSLTPSEFSELHLGSRLFCHFSVDRRESALKGLENRHI